MKRNNFCSKYSIYIKKKIKICVTFCLLDFSHLSKQRYL